MAVYLFRFPTCKCDLGLPRVYVLINVANARDKRIRSFLQLDGNVESKDQNFQALQRDPELSNTTRKHDHFFTAESSSLRLLIPPRFPYGSMGASLLFHVLVFLTLAFIQF